MSVVVSDVLCRFKLALPSRLFFLYNGRNRSAQRWLRLITRITVSLGRLWWEYFKNISGRSSSEESSNEDEPDSWLSNDQATIGTVNFAACGNYRPQLTKITKIWQDRSPIRKSSIMLRSRKTLFNLLHPLLFNPVPQNFLYGLCGWRFLRWRQLAHAISCFRALHHRWHFASSSSWIWILFMKFSLDEPESEDGWPLIHKKIKKKIKYK